MTRQKSVASLVALAPGAAQAQGMPTSCPSYETCKSLPTEANIVVKLSLIIVEKDRRIADLEGQIRAAGLSPVEVRAI